MLLAFLIYLWLALINTIYSRIAPFFCSSKYIFFPANEKAFLKHKFSTVYRPKDHQLIISRTDYKILSIRNWILPFQIWCNKVVIELSGVQFWFEIILVISNYVYSFRLNYTQLSSIIINLLVINLIRCNSLLYNNPKYLIRRSQICSSSPRLTKFKIKRYHSYLHRPSVQLRIKGYRI